MSKHLNHITQPIKGYISKNNNKSLTARLKKHNKDSVLPPALKLAIIRGQAHTHIACFSFFANKNFDDAFVYDAYQKIYHESNAIMDFIQHCGLINHSEDYIVKGLTNTSKDYKDLCEQLFYMLIDHLYEYEPRLFQLATVGFIQHYFPSFYPKQSKVKPSLEQLKKILQKQLNKKLHSKVIIKESFTTDDIADFTLKVRVQGYYDYELIRVTAKRIRSARFQAYHQALEKLNNDSLIIELQAKAAKKNKPIAPLQ